jgi:hypothetical protein
MMHAVRVISTLLVLVPMAPAMEDTPLVTPKQARYLEEAQQKAAQASQNAEAELIKVFQGPKFRAGLLFHGMAPWLPWRLATLPATELLARVKTALASMEYTSNFGVSEDFRKQHPGQPSMNFSTIDTFGRIPTMWELRALNSSLVAGIPEKQWKVLEAAETGLYQLPISETSKLPVGPTQTEAALERPQYVATNVHSRADIGVPRYGVYGGVIRNGVIRKRAVMLGSDSGGWENVCNKTVEPISHWMKFPGSLFCDCDGVYAGGKAQGRPIVGTLDHQLHTILANTVIFGITGGHLSRLVWELLDPNSNVRRLETLMYTEAALLGPLRPQDMKLLVASFPTIFGTPEADVLRAFCAKHKLPLAWALSSGETWDNAQISKSTISEWVPFSKLSDPVGGSRLLDLASWDLTNASSPEVDKVIWDEIEAEVKSLRKTFSKEEVDDKISASQFSGWFSTLSRTGGDLRPLRGSECADTDLCFGTYAKGLLRKRDCACRLPPPATVIV